MKNNNFLFTVFFFIGTFVFSACDTASTSQVDENNIDSVNTTPIQKIENDTSKNNIDSVNIELRQTTENNKTPKGIKFEILEEEGESFKDQILVVTEVPDETNLKAIQSILQKKQNYSGDAKKALIQKREKFSKSYDSYVKEYEEEQKANPNEEIGFYGNWEIERTIKVVFNENYFTTIGFYLYEYGGGIHGSSLSSYLILDLKNSKQIVLSDIFDEKGLFALKNKLQDKALKLAKKDGANSLQEHGFFDEKLELTKNFIVVEKGLEFEYQQGEITPHVMAPPTFLFEWNEIKDIMKADASVRSLIIE